MKYETKKKIKKGALIALQVTLGGFALFGMISTGALVKSCSKGGINTSAVVATTPVVGQRIKKLQVSDVPQDITYAQLVGSHWSISASSVNWFVGFSDLVSLPSSTGSASKVYLPVLTDKVIANSGAQFSTCPMFQVLNSGGYMPCFALGRYQADYVGVLDGGGNCYYLTSAQSSLNASTNLPYMAYHSSGYTTYADVNEFTIASVIENPYTATRVAVLSAYDFVVWALNNGYSTDLNFGTPITYDYAYCSPVGTLPSSVPNDYTSVTLHFQADSGFGFPDTGEEIPGYTQIYSEGLVIDSYTYGGYLGNGMYNAIEIQCSRDSDPPADSCHISVSALSTSGFEYPEWKTLRVLGTHCTIYMSSDQFDSEGVVHLQAYPDTGYYFDQERAFIGNQLKEYYGAEVVMYDLSTGGLYLTIRKNSENLVLNESPYIEITPLAGSVPVGGSDMGKAFDLLRDGFGALLPLFMIQVLPGITLGMLFMVPFIVILILFILKVVHK